MASPVSPGETRSELDHISWPDAVAGVERAG